VAQVTGRKVIPLDEADRTRSRLVNALGEVLAEGGYAGLTEEKVARRAGVDRRELFRQFRGLDRLVAAYGETSGYWPSAEELVGGDVAVFQALPLAEQFAAIYRNYLEALRRRPDTVRILAWETRERTKLTRILENVRVRRSLEHFELIQADFPEDIDMSAVVAIAAAAVLFLAVRTVTTRHFGGIDLDSDEGIARIGRTLEVLFERAFTDCDERLRS
jgi:AcrR family transcriptional regulator